MINWELACRVGSIASGSPAAGGPGSALLEQICEQALDAVVAYTGISLSAAIPKAESVSRPEWIGANAQSMSRLLDPLLQSADSATPGGLQLIGSAAATVEAGAALGLLSRKVLGQYDLSLVAGAEDPPPRLLFVGPNLQQVIAALGDYGDDFVRWVAVHEVTHAVQFGGVSWLRPYLGGLAAELVASFENPVRDSSPSASALVGGLATRAARAVTSRDPRAMLLTGRQAELLGLINAAMAVVEGHAEHVMDMACPDEIPSLPRLRSSMAERRSSQGLVWKLVAKLLGVDMKMRQYELGRDFCDQIVARAGMGALNQAWTEPAALPTEVELKAPDLWLKRAAA